MQTRLNTILRIFIGLLVASIGIISVKKFNADNDIENARISADFIFLPSETEIENNQRLAYLYSIAIALDKFKNDHKHYPITPDKGEGWSVIHVNDQEKIEWIDGIIPIYTENLPYRVIKNPNKNEQYVYQSDGANYKLLVYYPPDCTDVSVLSTVMTKNDRSEKCIGYGFWTKNSMWDTDPPLLQPTSN